MSFLEKVSSALLESYDMTAIRAGNKNGLNLQNLAAASGWKACLEKGLNTGDYANCNWAGL